MAYGPRNIESKDYNNKPVIPGNKKIWFLNGDLVRLHHSSRSTGMVTVYNITKDRLETCLRNDFRRNRSGHTLYHKLLNLSIGIASIFQD